MLSRIPSALIRAILIGVLFALPAFVVPRVAAENIGVISVVVIAMMAWTFMEYASRYPSLIEFRDAAPFNRIRFITLLVIVYCLSLIQSHLHSHTTTSSLVHNVGAVIGYSIDQIGSPVRLMLVQFPIVPKVMPYTAFLASVGIAYFVSLIALFVFMALFFLRKWPSKNGPFNIWINLPTFDPTSTGDIVKRLTRDARINIILGFLLPFIVPIGFGPLFRFLGASPFSDPYLMIWAIAAWAFLPCGMVMRGVALSRIAQMAAAMQRRYEVAQDQDSVSVPA